MSTSIQTEYQLAPEVAFAGMVADNSYMDAPQGDLIVEDGEIKFGQAMVSGTNKERDVILPSTTGQTFRGIAELAHTIEQTLTGVDRVSSRGSYIKGQFTLCRRRGIVWVQVVQDVQADDPAFFVHTNIDPTKIGWFRKDDDGGNADAVPTGVFRTAALAGKLAKLEINIP